MLKPKLSEEKILVAAAVAVIAFLVFSLSFFLVFVDRGFYDKSFQKYGAYETIGVDGVRDTVDYLIKYLTSDPRNASAAPGLYIFNEKEKSHLEDVHVIFKAAKYASIFALVALIAILLRLRAKDWLEEALRKILKISAVASTALLLALFILSINFGWFFTRFHYLFFPQGNWRFPSDSVLIIMFPQEFFQDFLIKAFFHILVISVVLYFLGTMHAPEEEYPPKKRAAKKSR